MFSSYVGYGFAYCAGLPKKHTKSIEAWMPYLVHHFGPQPNFAGLACQAWTV